MTESHYVVSRDETKIAYEKIGAGPILLYVTGASCFRNFTPIRSDVKEFAKEFTVINYDRRGRGDSADTAPYSVEREVEDIEALIDAVGGKVHIYGHSSGGVLALEAALALPDKIERVLVYDASYAGNTAEIQTYAQLSEQTRLKLANGDNAGAMKTFLKGIGMPGVFVAILPFFPGWKTMKALAPTLMYDIELTKDMPPVERLKSIDIPLMICWGSKSPAGIHDAAQQVIEVIPAAAHKELAGQDHMVSAKVLLPLLVSFIKKTNSDEV